MLINKIIINFSLFWLAFVNNILITKIFFFSFEIKNLRILKFVFQIRGKKGYSDSQKIAFATNSIDLMFAKAISQWIHKWKVYLNVFTTFGIPEEKQSVEHLVRKSNLHGDSLLSSDLNLRIGIHWGEISLHGLYDFHGFFFRRRKINQWCI